MSSISVLELWLQHLVLPKAKSIFPGPSRSLGSLDWKLTDTCDSRNTPHIENCYLRAYDSFWLLINREPEFSDCCLIEPPTSKINKLQNLHVKALFFIFHERNAINFFRKAVVFFTSNQFHIIQVYFKNDSETFKVNWIEESFPTLSFAGSASSKFEYFGT